MLLLAVHPPLCSTFLFEFCVTTAECLEEVLCLITLADFVPHMGGSISSLADL